VILRFPQQDWKGPQSCYTVAMRAEIFTQNYLDIPPGFLALQSFVCAKDVLTIWEHLPDGVVSYSTFVLSSML
jgi:hypothetical protein